MIKVTFNDGLNGKTFEFGPKQTVSHRDKSNSRENHVSLPQNSQYHAVIRVTLNSVRPFGKNHTSLD